MINYKSDASGNLLMFSDWLEARSFHVSSPVADPRVSFCSARNEVKTTICLSRYNAPGTISHTLTNNVSPSFKFP